MTEPDRLEWLAGSGELGRAIAELDWSRTPLGPISGWPLSLRTTVSLCLASNFPINIIWGEGHTQIYNQGYRVVCGAAHPRALGEDYRVTWASAWPAIGEPFERALRGETSYLENQRMFLERNGYPEETFFTFSLSPIRDGTGKVAGLFHPVTETTATMLAQRRTRALRELGDKAAKATVFDDACSLLLQTLHECSLDLPFAILYLLEPDGVHARLRGAVGVHGSGDRLMPAQLRLDAENAGTGWPLSQALEARGPVELSDLRVPFGEVTCGPYPEPARAAFVLPIRVAGVDRPLGFLMVGASTRLPLDDGYRAFFEMLGGAASAALGNARAYELERQRAEQLAELDRSKTQFFSNVSHEFRTPLTLMLGPLEELLGGRVSALAPEVVSELEVVHRNSLRLLKLVNSLLDFSRVEARTAPAAQVAADLPTLTEDTASTFRSAIERAGLEYVVQVERFPQPVPVDPDMWEKILLNLLSNAFKFTSEGRIQVSLRSRGGFAELEVSDTGIGIPAQELPRMFERFHRVQGAAGRSHEGSGIGLALVNELTKLQGGEVSVESKLGAGTTFRIRIPLALTGVTALAAQPGRDAGAARTRAQAFVHEAMMWSARDERRSPEHAPAPETASGRRRVLIADDNADMRAYVLRLLSEHYEVTSVRNGQEALEEARRLRPDLVLSDVMMPVLDGLELIQRLRADPSLRTLPVILLSARAGDEARIGGISSGADDYLVKPFSSRELLARVASQLKMAELRSSAAEQKARMALLEAQRTRLERVLDDIPTPVSLIDPRRGTYTFTNRAAREMAGGVFPETVEESIGGPRFQLTDKSGAPLAPEQSPAGRLIQSEVVRDAEVVWRTPAGAFDLLVDTASVPPSEGEAETAIVSFRDVTRLRDVEKELADAITARDDFLSIASHELKTPLTSLQLQLELTQQTLERGDLAAAPERLARAFKLSSVQLRRLARLVDDLLDVGRIRSGQLHLAFEPCDLTGIVRDAVDRMTPQLTVAACPVRFQLQDGVQGFWDEERVRQVVSNLLANAIKYAPQAPIDVGLSARDGLARIEVRDFGPGVAPGVQDAIFERFHRGNASRNAGGLGLGLFISRRIAEAHGGALRIESPAGGGVRFVVELKSTVPALAAPLPS